MAKKPYDRMDPTDLEDIAEFDAGAAARFRRQDNMRTGGKHGGKKHIPGQTADFIGRIEEERQEPNTGQGTVPNL